MEDFDKELEEYHSHVPSKLHYGRRIPRFEPYAIDQNSLSRTYPTTANSRISRATEGESQISSRQNALKSQDSTALRDDHEARLKKELQKMVRVYNSMVTSNRRILT